MTRRLIEKWLPIAELSEESARERRSMTALPPTYYLHVWWARRPLVASRAAILACLLPEDADRGKFLHMLGIHGDPVESRRRIDHARRTGQRFEGEAYSYKRAFSYAPRPDEVAWAASEAERASLTVPTVLDPTAGGGSIPFESSRLGMHTIANDLNPVAALILRATVEFPRRHGPGLVEAYERLADAFVKRRDERIACCYPTEPEADCISTNYLWARTVVCPYCHGVVPLSPNWRLSPRGTGVRLRPRTDGERRCDFEIVDSAAEHSGGTVARGRAQCPFPDCGRVIDGNEIKKQGQDLGLGEQLYAIAYKRRVATAGKRGKWERGYRAPLPSDFTAADVEARLAARLPEWEVLDIVPTEEYPAMQDDRVRAYGVRYWRDLFSARQLVCHGTSVEVFRELFDMECERGEGDDATRAAFGYLAIAIDKMLDWNSRQCTWHAGREVTGHTFQKHSYSIIWQYAEMVPLSSGVGHDWATRQIGKSLKELVKLAGVGGIPSHVRSDQLFDTSRLGSQQEFGLPPSNGTLETEVTVMCESADSLVGIDDGQGQQVVIGKDRRDLLLVHLGAHRDRRSIREPPHGRLAAGQ